MSGRIRSFLLRFMNAELPPIKSHSWRLTGTIPNSKQKYPNYGENFSVGVEATTIEEAIRKARELIPEAQFFNIHHHGPIHIS